MYFLPIIASCQNKLSSKNTSIQISIFPLLWIRAFFSVLLSPRLTIAVSLAFIFLTTLMLFSEKSKGKNRKKRTVLKLTQAVIIVG